MVVLTMSAFPESGRSDLLKWPDFRARFRPQAAISFEQNHAQWRGLLGQVWYPPLRFGGAEH